MTDNIFRRLHSLKPPSSGEDRPILVEENPSRDFFFPLTAREALSALEGVSTVDVGEITHIWLRRGKPGESTDTSHPLAEFICGSCVRVIVLYPWRRDLLLCLGPRKPEQKRTRPYLKYGAEIFISDGSWYARFPESQLRAFYIEHLLVHEFGHHLDWYKRRWSRANNKKVEDFANQYAVRWGRAATEVIDKLSAAEES